MSSRSSSNSRPHSGSFPVIPDYYGVGWIKAAHGIRGEVFIRLVAGQADWSEQTDSVLLLSQDGTSRNFTFQSFRPHKEGLIAKFREVADRTQAETLIGHKVYVLESALEAKPGEPIFLKQILGFSLIEAGSGRVLGIVSGFATNGPQDLLTISRDGKEALVPFVDAFLVNIDFDKKEVTMDLPEGLLNVEEE